MKLQKFIFSQKSSITLKNITIFLLLLCSNITFSQTVEVGKSSNNPTPAAGTSLDYTLDFRCTSITNDCESVVISDVIPTGLNYVGAVSSLGGTVAYDLGTNTMTVTYSRGSFGNGLQAGDVGQVVITVIVPSNTPNGTTFNNTGTISSPNAGTNSSMASVTSIAANTGPPGIKMDKISAGNIAPSGNSSYNLAHGNTGNTLIQNYVVEDCMPTGIYVNNIEAGAFAGTNNTVSVFYKTNNNNTSWLPWTGTSTFSSGTTTTMNISSLGLGAGEFVTCVRFEYGDLDGSGAFGGTAGNGALKINVFGDNSLTLGTTLQNCATATATGYSKQGCADLYVETANNKLYSYKSIPSGPFSTGQSMDFYTGIILPASNATPTNGFVIADLLPSGFSYVAGSASPSGTGWVTGGSVAFFEEVISNFAGTGRTLVRWSWNAAHGNDFTIPASSADQTIGINLKAIPSNPGTGVQNCIYGSTENLASFASMDNPVVDVNDYDNDGNTTESVTSACTTFDVIGVASAAGLESYKEVKGQVDNTWTRYPQSGTTVAGGRADYRLVVKNPNSVPMTNIKIIDILPFIGDKGVIDPQNRLSEWQPNLAGPVTAPNGVIVYYSTETNPCRDEVKLPNAPSPFPSGCNNPNWTTTPPSNITDVRAVKFDFGSMILNQNDQITLEWPMRAPVNAPSNGQIAWNSFGYASTRADNNMNLLPSEPIKVGIKLDPIAPAIIGDRVWLDTNQNGVQDASETAGVDGVRVELYQSNGTFVDFTITANNGLYIFPNLSAGDYYLKFTLPNGYTQSPKDRGNDDALDSDADLTTLQTSVTTLVTTEDDRTWDLGIFIAGNCAPPTLTIAHPSPVCEPSTVDITSASVQTTNTGVTTTYFHDAAATNPIVSPNAIASSSIYYIKSSTSDASCFEIKPVNVTINSKPTTPNGTTRNNTCPTSSVDISDLLTIGFEIYDNNAHNGTPKSTSETNNLTSNVTFYLFEKSIDDCYSDPATINVVINSCATPCPPKVCSPVKITRL